MHSGTIALTNNTLRMYNQNGMHLMSYGSSFLLFMSRYGDEEDNSVNLTLLEANSTDFNDNTIMVGGECKQISIYDIPTGARFIYSIPHYATCIKRDGYMTYLGCMRSCSQ